MSLSSKDAPGDDSGDGSARPSVAEANGDAAAAELVGLGLSDASSASTSALSLALGWRSGWAGRECSAEDLRRWRTVTRMRMDRPGRLRGTAGCEGDPCQEKESADGHEKATSGGLKVHG